MLNPSSFITTDPLVDFSIKAANEMSDFIADEIFSPVIVSKESFKIYQYDTSNFRVRSLAASSKAAAPSVDYSVFTRSASAQLHKAQSEWDPNDADQFDAVVANLEQDCALTITEALMLEKEIAAATLATTTTNYPASLTATLGASATWISTGGDPEGTSATARTAVKTACGKVPNAAAMAWTTFEKLKAAPYFIDRMKYTNASVSNDAFAEMLKAWMGVQYLHVGRAQKNTNLEGNATQSLSDVWGDGILFYVKNTSVSPKTMRYGANYVYNQMYTHKREDSNRGGPKGRIQVVEMGLSYVLASAAVVSSSDTDFTAGYYLSNVV